VNHKRVQRIRRSIASFSCATPNRCGSPGAEAAFQRAAQVIPVVIGTAAAHFLRQRHGPNAGTAGKQRQDLALPQPAKRVDDLPPQRSLAAFWEGSRGSASIRRPVRSLTPVLRQQRAGDWWQRSSMYTLTCWPVAGRPGKSDLFLEVEVPILLAHTPRPEGPVKPALPVWSAYG
jgi:hypothetical protein